MTLTRFDAYNLIEIPLMSITVCLIVPLTVYMFTFFQVGTAIAYKMDKDATVKVTDLW